MSESPASLRIEILAPFVVVVIAIAAGMNAIDASPVGVFYDDALYTILGKSVASGTGYRYLNIPGLPPATHYPPAYPWLLALLWKISPRFPENIAIFKTVNALLLGVVAFFTYRFGRMRLAMPALLAAGAAIAATATIPPLVLSSAVLSETLFLALLLPALLYVERTSEKGIRGALIAGLIASSLCLVRSHAIALLAAVAIAYLLPPFPTAEYPTGSGESSNRRGPTQRLYKEGALATVTGAVVLSPWIVWVQTHDSLIPAPIRGQYGSYTAWFADALRTHGLGLLLPIARDNISTSYAIVARSFSVARNPVLDAMAVAAVLALLIAGAICFARRARITLLFLALYLAIVLVWPFSPLRFIWGVWPLCTLLLFAGARQLWLSSRRFARPIAVAASMVALSGALFFNINGYRNAWWATVSRSYTSRIRAQLDWVANRTNPSDVIAGSDEGAVFLYTGRQAIPTSVFRAAEYVAIAPADESARDLSVLLRTFRPTYVLAWTVPAQNAAARLAASLVFADTMPGGRVYRPR